MIEIHPNYITKEGKREFVILTYEEFTMIQELLRDYEDLRDLREAKADEADAPTLTLKEAKAKLNIA